MTEEQLARKRAYMRDYNRRNAEKRKAYMLEYNERKRGQTREYMKQHDAKRAKDPVRDAYKKRYNETMRPVLRQRDRAYRERKRDWLNERARARWPRIKPKQQIYGRNWRQANPDKVRETEYRRRARVADAGPVDGEHVARLRALGRCPYCRTVYQDGHPRHHFTLDHKVPLARGGTNANENLVGMCKSCNSRKGALDYEVFLSRVAPHLLDPPTQAGLDALAPKPRPRRTLPAGCFR